MVNTYDPLSFPIREGLEGDGNGDEYMPLESVRRVSEAGYDCRLPVEQWGLYALALMDSIDIRQRITMSSTSRESPGQFNRERNHPPGRRGTSDHRSEFKSTC
jgi:hypothetical protein